MSKLRILIHDIGIPTPDFDYRQSGAKGLYPLLRELHKLLDFEEIWLYSKVGSKNIDDNTNGYYALNFRDSLDLIDRLKPDLVLTRSDYEFLTRSIILAAKHRQIPTVVLISIRPYRDDMIIVDLRRTIKARLSWLRQNGRNIVRRYLFLLRTQSSIGISFLQNIKIIVTDFQLTFKTDEPTFRLGYGDLYVCNNAGWYNHLITYGIDKDKLTIAGECALDLTYDRLKSMESKEITRQMNILFITTSVVEHGAWTPAMRDTLVTGVLESLSNTLSDAVITIKIQPGEPLEHYTRMAKSINSELKVIETGDLLSMIQEADIVISFSASTALFEALFLNKPIFMINLYDTVSRNIFILKKLAVECRSIEQLVNNIKNANSLRPSQKLIDEFIEEQMYKFDGKCSFRAANAIVNLLNKRIDIG